MEVYNDDPFINDFIQETKELVARTNLCVNERHHAGAINDHEAMDLIGVLINLQGILNRLYPPGEP